jgi:hypothetical protein
MYPQSTVTRCADIEFLVKVYDFAANIFDQQLRHMHGPCISVRSVQKLVKHLKHGNRGIANLPCSSQQSTTTSREYNEQKIDVLITEE